jgi:hypothetical protein
MRRLRVTLFGTAVLCLGGAANAQGEPKKPTATYALSFVRGAGAEGCPSRQELEREVSTRLGHSPFESVSSRSIEILTERTAEGYRSVVSVLDQDGKLLGRRVLVGEEPTCTPIFSATALAVALLIDPEAALSRDSRAKEAVGRFDTDEAPAPRAAEPPPLPPSPPPAPPPAQSPPIVAPPPPAPVARDDLTVVVGVDAVAAVGLVPDMAPGVDVAFHARPGRPWGFSLSALYVSKASAEAQGRTVDVSVTTFAAALTLSAVDTASFGVLADAGLAAGILHASVRQGQATGSGDFPFLAAGLGLRAEARVSGGLVLAARLGGVVPLVRRVLSVEDAPDELIWEQPAIGGIGSLGAGWAFF